jgi:ABC-type glycerol-3-phosphate transport system substrate-binding protein
MRALWLHKFWSGLGMAVLLVCTACQGSPIVVRPTSSTGVANTPAPKSTLPPIATPTPEFTPTAELPAYLRVQPADLKGQQVRFWHALTGDSSAQLEELARQFNLHNEWGIQVSLTSQGAAGPLASAVDQAKLEDLPEVVLAPSEQLAEWQQARSLLVDLNLYLDQATWGMPKIERDEFLPVFWQQDQSFAKTGSESIPEQLGIPVLRTATGLIYNRSFARDLGFPTAPQSVQDLLDQACAASKKNNAVMDRLGTGGWMLDTTSLSALSWMAVFGAEAAPASP